MLQYELGTDINRSLIEPLKHNFQESGCTGLVDEFIKNLVRLFEKKFISTTSKIWSRQYSKLRNLNCSIRHRYFSVLFFSVFKFEYRAYKLKLINVTIVCDIYFVPIAQESSTIYDRYRTCSHTKSWNKGRRLPRYAISLLPDINL